MATKDPRIYLCCQWNEIPLRLHSDRDPSVVALGTKYSLVIFSSLNSLKLAPLTVPLRVGKEAFLGERLFLFYYLLPYVTQGCLLR